MFGFHSVTPFDSGLIRWLMRKHTDTHWSILEPYLERPSWRRKAQQIDACVRAGRVHVCALEGFAWRGLA